jgi:TetR/AcrR family transcriptional regulator
MAVTIKKLKGRPAGPNTGDIRQSILKSAEQLFAEKGYAAVSIKEIAEGVNVNPAMIHYYFGNKNKLLQQVLERALEPLAVAIGTMQSADHSPIPEIAKLLLNTFHKHPFLPYLVVREVLLPGGVMQEHFLSFLAPRLGGALPALISREQKAGRVRRDVDPHYGALTLISLCAFPFFARNLAEPGLNISYDQAGLKQLENHITLLLSEGYST